MANDNIDVENMSKYSRSEKVIVWGHCDFTKNDMPDFDEKKLEHGT